MKLFTALVLAAPFALVHAHPCDKEHEEHCGAFLGAELGECLAKVARGTEVTEGKQSCEDWYQMHQKCAKELETCEIYAGAGLAAWGTDARYCLENKRGELSDECAKSLPAEEKKEMSAAAKARKEQRKANRAKGADEVRNYEANKKKEEEEAARKKEEKKKKKAAKKASKKKQSEL